jgi:hypothetical protein
MKVILLYSPGDTPGTHSCYRLNQSQDHRAAEKIKPMKHTMNASRIKIVTFRLVAQCHDPYGDEKGSRGSIKGEKCNIY